jgi:hypothetical protein
MRVSYSVLLDTNWQRVQLFKSLLKGKNQICIRNFRRINVIWGKTQARIWLFYFVFQTELWDLEELVTVNANSNRFSHTQGRDFETPADIRLGCLHGRAGGEVAVERGVILRHTTHKWQLLESACALQKATSVCMFLSHACLCLRKIRVYGLKVTRNWITTFSSMWTWYLSEVWTHRFFCSCDPNR